MKFRSRVTVGVLGLLTLLLIGACGTSSDEGVPKGTGPQSEAGGQAAQTGVQQGAATSAPTRLAIREPNATIPLSEGAIAPAVAAAHIGEEIEVCGFVAEVVYERDMEGRPTYVRFDQIAPDQTFQVMIPGKRRPRWPNPPEMYYPYTQACAKGLIEEIDGKPTMIIENQYQLLVPAGGGYGVIQPRTQQEIERKARDAEKTKEAQK